MKTDENHSPGSHCACTGGDGRCAGGNGRRLSVSQRQFLAAGSGCLLGTLSGVGGAPAAKLPSVDIGPLKSFTQEGISEDFIRSDFFVIRHQDRLFAVSTTCPHMGNTLQRDPLDATRIKCGGHGSVFDGEGVVMVGPAWSGLTRLGISVDGKGHVVVNPNKEFPQDKWTEKGCFLVVK